MKKFLLIIAVLLTGSISLFAQQAASQKIGFVDSQTMLKALPEAIKAQGDLDDLTKRYYAHVDSLTAQLQQMYNDFQKQQNTMKPNQLKEAQQQFVTKQQDLESFKQQKFGQNGELAKRSDELFAPIKERILKGIQEVAKDEGMSFVFDKTGDVVLLFADTSYDITYKVLDKLKRGK
ncbi:MAG: OmpH family outer membrane protein [Syntrophomonadaceae bacterium]